MACRSSVLKADDGCGPSYSAGSGSPSSRGIYGSSSWALSSMRCTAGVTFTDTRADSDCVKPCN